MPKADSDKNSVFIQSVLRIRINMAPDSGSRDLQQRFKVFLMGQETCYAALGNIIRDVYPGSRGKKNHKNPWSGGSATLQSVFWMILVWIRMRLILIPRWQIKTLILTTTRKYFVFLLRPSVMEIQLINSNIFLGRYFDFPESRLIHPDWCGLGAEHCLLFSVRIWFRGNL